MDGERVTRDEAAGWEGGGRERPPRWREARSSSTCRSSSPVRGTRPAYDMRRVNSAAAGGLALEPEGGRSRSLSYGGAGSSTDRRLGSRASLNEAASRSGMAGMTPLGGRQSLDSDAPLPELGMPLLRDENQNVCCGMADFCESRQQRRICGGRPLSRRILPERCNCALLSLPPSELTRNSCRSASAGGLCGVSCYRSFDSSYVPLHPSFRAHTRRECSQWPLGAAAIQGK